MRPEASPPGIAALVDTLCEAFSEPVAGQFVASSKTSDKGGVHLQYLEAPNVGILLLNGTGGA